MIRQLYASSQNLPLDLEKSSSKVSAIHTKLVDNERAGREVQSKS